MQTITPLTSFDDIFVGLIAVSPDGGWILIERTIEMDVLIADLWIARIDGSEARLFVPGGTRTTWTAQINQEENPRARKQIILPLLCR